MKVQRHVLMVMFNEQHTNPSKQVKLYKQTFVINVIINNTIHYAELDPTITEVRDQDILDVYTPKRDDIIYRTIYFENDE